MISLITRTIHTREGGGRGFLRREGSESFNHSGHMEVKEVAASTFAMSKRKALAGRLLERPMLERKMPARALAWVRRQRTTSPPHQSATTFRTSLAGARGCFKEGQA